MDLPTVQLDDDIIREESQPSSLKSRTTTPKTICVIGAGAGGLASLKIILDSLQYKRGRWKPIVYEARDKIGGVWVPAPPTDDPPLTPIYDSLTTNLPHPVMAFTSYAFPPSTPVFPHASVVQKYLEDYADHFNLTSHIQLNTIVKTVDRDDSGWKIGLSSGETAHFDFVVVCNGHYRVPRYPNIPGLAQWFNEGKASHSAWYRRPHNVGDTVLVVGAGPSGQDISTEMRGVAHTVIHSMTGATRQDVGNLKLRGRVAEFRDNGEVLFGDGTTESGISYCILATGYKTSFPFFSNQILRSGPPPPAPPLPGEIYNSTYHVFPLARHLFPVQTVFHPSCLVFIGLLIKAAPFPLMEAQARAMLRAFENPEALSPTQEAVGIMTRYESLRTEFGDDDILISKAWHRFKGGEQFDYRDELYEFAGSDVTVGGEGGYMKVPEWEREMYEKKDILRKTWVELEKSGEADAWVRGVGENGPHEWIELLRKMLKFAEEQSIHVGELDKSRL